MSKNHQIHNNELDSPKNLMQYNYKIVPDLRSLKHTDTHENATTASLKHNKKDLEQSIERIMGHSLLQ